MGKTIEESGNLERKQRSAAQTAILMAFLTLISKCLGFIREMIFAGFFGTGYVMDAYVMAQSIPSMLVAGVLSAVSTSFMPIFSDKMEQEGETAGNRFVNEVLDLLTKTAIVVATFGVIFSTQLVEIFASGFRGEQAALTAFFLKIAFIYFIFSACNDLITKYLQYKNVFLPQVAFGYVQNFLVVGFAILAAYVTEKLLIFGLLFSYIIIHFLLLWMAKREGFTRKVSFRNSDVARPIIALALPVFIGGYVSTINTYVDRMLASELPEGSVAALNYAVIIIGLVSGLTVSIISTITFPRLNKARAQENQGKYNEVLCKSFNLNVIITIPFSLGAMFFSNEVVQIIYERGAFNEEATAMTAVALFWYGPYLCLSQLNAQSIYAFQTNKDMKTPMYIGVVSVIVNICFNIILVRVMGIGGLALATSIATIVSLTISLLVLKKKYEQIRIVESWGKLGKIIITAIFSIICSKLVYIELEANIWMPRACYLMSSILIAGIVYLIGLKHQKVSELNLIKTFVKK